MEDGRYFAIFFFLNDNIQTLIPNIEEIQSGGFFHEAPAF